MPSLVHELEQDTYSDTAHLSNMLRKAKAIAAKLQLQQPMEWVDAELNGYKDLPVPDYRKVRGTVKFLNPYHGWQQLIIEDYETEQLVCTRPIYNSVKEIEHLIESEGTLSISLTGRHTQLLCNMANMPTMPMSIFFSKNAFVSILDEVRNKVLDWSLSLQAAGIKGEGMSFLPEEKAKVSENSGHTYNIGAIGSFAGNLGGQIGGDVTASSTQHVHQELEKVAALISQLRIYQDQMGLDTQKQAAVNHYLDELEKEQRKAEPQPHIIIGLLSSIKSVAEEVATNLVASGVISAISNISL
ncbi:hypothetical protein [Acetobacter sp. P5B1]|uniref:AbiTii domain-containing protein n=1 Tax=Acetobacter sp. P5B1 TaxID=2762620 RepID=UPI001C048FA6|nr:hypothetical protein [Acetobacter sp. P5B1]